VKKRTTGGEKGGGPEMGFNSQNEKHGRGCNVAKTQGGRGLEKEKIDRREGEWKGKG